MPLTSLSPPPALPGYVPEKGPGRAWRQTCAWDQQQVGPVLDKLEETRRRWRRWTGIRTGRWADASRGCAWRSSAGASPRVGRTRLCGAAVNGRRPSSAAAATRASWWILDHGHVSMIVAVNPATTGAGTPPYRSMRAHRVYSRKRMSLGREEDMHDKLMG